ncbi:GNAT family N-acetyltransferase [Rhodococcus qingshengii]|uniref:GNAT family N-acetyltransferase n=1 Tax=Rhodococcus qingshengii TaxID=334542 RepID=UPI0036DC7000
MTILPGRQSPVPTLHVRPMRRSDWEWVQQWFEDETLNRELGPLDEEWLIHVLSQSDGVQLIVEENTDSDAAQGNPVALVGVAWGRAEHEESELSHGITDIAIDPARRRSSLGRHTIDAVCTWPGHPEVPEWIVFVDQRNAAAFAFFTAIGWTHKGLDSTEDGSGTTDPDAMHRFVRARSNEG